MKILVLGGGAIGSTIAAYLTRAAVDEVVMADGWFAHVEAVRRDGLHVETVEGDVIVAVEAIHLDELAGLGQLDLIMIAGKSYDTRVLALLAREHLHDGTVVMSAQNGMNDATVAAVVGERHTAACVVPMAADLYAPGRVRRTSPDTATALIVGPYPSDDPGPDVAPHAGALGRDGAFGAVSVVPDIRPERWGKLTLNTMSNAMAGLTGLRSENLWSTAEVVDVVTAIAHETATVAAASGVAAAPVLGRISHATLLAADTWGNDAWRDVHSFMRDTSGERVGRSSNRASLLQDIEKGRRTEVHHLNGWVAATASQLGVQTPVNARITTEVESVELGLRPPALANIDGLVELVHKVYG